MRTFNKRGDQGETSLRYGVRVSKADLRCEAYGTVDEASSALGLAKHWTTPKVSTIILQVQKDLRLIGAELATPKQQYSRLPQDKRVTPKMVDALESLITGFEQELTMPQDFVLPGGCLSAAVLDLARTILRRAERVVVRLKEAQGLSNPEVLRYLNRLADLIYTLARFEESQCPPPVSP